MFPECKPDYRTLVVGTDTKIPLPGGQEVVPINFDNAATTPPFASVLQSVVNFAPWYSSIHRGTGYKSQYSTEMYEESREVVRGFVNADSNNTVIFVKNASEAINKLSYRLHHGNTHRIVLSTFMEHHSNDLPWRNKYDTDYIKVNYDGRLSLEDLEKKLRKYGRKVALLAITGASNVTGYKNPVYDIAELAHKYGAEVMVDAAQLAGHGPIDMKPSDSPRHIDYIVFSSHKMYAPFGTGVLIGPEKTFMKRAPEYRGGGTVDIVTHDFVKWAGPPHRDEAGTPNVIGAIALSQAVKTLNSIGMENIEAYESSLAHYALLKLKTVPNIKFYCDRSIKDRVGIIPFNIDGLHHQIVAEALSEESGIAVRNGCFCAQPYVQWLMNIPRGAIRKLIKHPSSLRPGMVRISFGLYNNFDEIDTLIRKLSEISENRKAYTGRYGV